MAIEAWDIGGPANPTPRGCVATMVAGVNETLTAPCVGEIELVLPWAWDWCCRELSIFCWNTSSERAGIAFSSFSTSNGCNKSNYQCIFRNDKGTMIDNFMILASRTCTTNNNHTFDEITVPACGFCWTGGSIFSLCWSSPNWSGTSPWFTKSAVLIGSKFRFEDISFPEWNTMFYTF